MKIRLEQLTRTDHQIALCFSADGLRFQTSYWYADCNLRDLERRYGQPMLESIYFHIAAFEANKLVSLRPAEIDWGDWQHHQTAAFQELWRTVVHHVWAQWRFENDEPSYKGPRLSAPAASRAANPIELQPSSPPAVAEPPDTLAFCGGGKDSLVALKLLERSGIPFASLQYSHSIYGPAGPQHALIDRLLDHCVPIVRRRMWIFDDFLDSPVLDLHPEWGIRTLTAAETPSSLFAALPLALAHGYRHFVLAHERSADFGNLHWEATGEEVNHQWGKSAEAERLLNDYVQRELIANLHYFSPIKSLSDVVIFHMLRRDEDRVAATHSCNVRKPWCGRCAKCAYVWLSYMAYLDPARVAPLFGGENLLERPENQDAFARMFGLADHTPFECIGQPDEARLALALAGRRGLQGPALDRYTRAVGPLNVAALLDRYATVDPQATSLPATWSAKILPHLEAAAQDCRTWIKHMLDADRD